MNELRCLEEAWSRYTAISEPENLSGKEELETLSLLAKTLQSVVDLMDRVRTETSASFSQLKERLASLTSSISSLRPSGRGGMFEWVDSMLVKAVRDGHWLLVDNVNFCSASVLDRLNALLEPHGELSINERGTVDGQIPSIKPHPNFRLFFAMDPRYGEISRAMRNRGIEIYILGEEDGSSLDRQDILHLLQDSGLEDPRDSSWLLDSHMTLQATLPRGDRLTIVDMLQVAVSCSLLVKRGVTKCEAFRHAMEDVYVSPRSTLQLKKHLRAAISECLQLLQESGQGEKTLMLWSQAVPGESSWMLQLKANARFLFSQIQEAAASKSSDVPAVRVQLCTAAGIVQSLLSEPGHSLLGQWLDTVWPSFQSALAAGVGEGREKEEVDALLADVRAVLSGSSAHVFESSAWRDLQAAVERMFSSSSAAQALMSELPWDLSHNPQALTHALWFSTSGDGEDPGQEIRTCVQRLQLVQQASAVAQALGKKVQELEKVVLKGGRGTPSALGLILLVLSEMATSLPRLVELLPPEALALP
ncbi:midasin-like, partial [Aplysia californica]|uniref:Midasin-like n=1 Tax=Aplysia californica TaxID=6500 RepID=A0ABM1VXH4_APLCA